MADQQENQDSFILIRFKDIGSVVLDMQINNVTPLQVIAAAEFLGIKGKNTLLQQENERLERERDVSLAVPSNHGKILIGR